MRELTNVEVDEVSGAERIVCSMTCTTDTTPNGTHGTTTKHTCTLECHIE